MRYFYSLFFICFCFAVNAQDFHFSQFYFSPLTLNPALTGAIDGKYRVNAIYKNQWSSVQFPFYSTPCISGDIKINSSEVKENYLGVGIYVLNDLSGNGNFSTLNAMLSVAYHLALDADGNQHISVGLQGGVIQQRFDLSALVFPDQWNGSDYGNSTQEHFDHTSIAFADFSAGATYYGLLSQNIRLQVGGAVFHLTEPKDAFYTNDDNVLMRRYLAHASATFGFNNKFYIFPFAQYQKQSSAQELVAGANFGFGLGNPLQPDNSTLFYIGLFHRYQVDLIPTFGFMKHGFQVGFSYDVGVGSQIQQLDNGRGGFEVSLSYVAGAGRELKRQIPCPTF